MNTLKWLRKSNRIGQPRGPWKAKGQERPRQIALYVCLFCKAQFGATGVAGKGITSRRLPHSGAYARPTCIEFKGGLAEADQEALLLVMQAHGTPRGEKVAAQP